MTAHKQLKELLNEVCRVALLAEQELQHPSDYTLEQKQVFQKKLEDFWCQITELRKQVNEIIAAQNEENK